jgi:hypothetical protein
MPTSRAAPAPSLVERVDRLRPVDLDDALAPVEVVDVLDADVS